MVGLSNPETGCATCGNWPRIYPTSAYCSFHHKEYMKKWHKKNYATKTRNAQYLRLFGITLEQYEKILIEQQGVCVGCGISQEDYGKFFSVDHDHILGYIRGLLCSHCNLVLGNAKDNPDTLRKLADYLEDF